MSKNIDKIAAFHRAMVISQVHIFGAGDLGSSRDDRIAQYFQARLVQGEGHRPGRTSESIWVHHPKAQMS